jgi:hypothetical protein
MAQTVNMDRYITLDVTPQHQIELYMNADAPNTGVKLVSGSSVNTISVGTDWIYIEDFVSGASTITIYGNVKMFSCVSNGTNLTGVDISNNRYLTKLSCNSNSISSLDVSGCERLEYLSCSRNPIASLNISGCNALNELYCYDSELSTQAYDMIFCDLPQRQIYDEAKVYPVKANNSTNYATVMATNKQNAIDKQWSVIFLDGNDIPSTSGNFNCDDPTGPPAGTPYITVSVSNNATISIDIMAVAENTPIWIETSNGNFIETSVGTGWTGFNDYTAIGNTIKVYGAIKSFDCHGNNDKLTGLAFSEGFDNFELLQCDNNQITVLDVTKLSNLKSLFCHRNNINELNVNGLDKIEWLWCEHNELTFLDVSTLTSILGLQCYGNPLDTQAIDDIYCAVPERESNSDSRLYIAYNDTDQNIEAILASNATNARQKNWYVLYLDFDYLTGEVGLLYNSPIPTTGNFSCNDGIQQNELVSASILPNPVNDMLNVECPYNINEVVIYNMFGVEMLRTNQADNINVSHFVKGMYIVSVRTEKGTIEQKLIKQ